jgi:hypothetical protein
VGIGSGAAGSTAGAGAAGSAVASGAGDDEGSVGAWIVRGGSAIGAAGGEEAVLAPVVGGVVATAGAAVAAATTAFGSVGTGGSIGLVEAVTRLADAAPLGAVPPGQLRAAFWKARPPLTDRLRGGIGE